MIIMGLAKNAMHALLGICNVSCFPVLGQCCQQGADPGFGMGMAIYIIEPICELHRKMFA